MTSVDGARPFPALGVLAPVLVLLGGPPARAQTSIQDNSFLIEEAYNQERGVVQHISTFSRVFETGDWISTFTQEWPVSAETHQLSFTLPLQRLQAPGGTKTGAGDVALNYRYQLLGNGEARLAVAPRLSLMLPTGRARDGLGLGGAGVQVDLASSLVVSPKIVVHGNAGATRTFSARNPADERADVQAYNLGASVVYLVHPRINLLLETVWTRAESVIGPGRKEPGDDWLLNPGVRWSYDLRSGVQIVPGVAFPIGVGPSRGTSSFMLYLSFEHPFRKKI